jgi:hypothetical protein
MIPMQYRVLTISLLLLLMTLWVVYREGIGVGVMYRVTGGGGPSLEPGIKSESTVGPYTRTPYIQ